MQELNQQAIDAMSVEQLETAIKHHNRLYWDHNAPEISDTDYDRLVRALRAMAPNSSVLQDMGPTDVGRYGAQVTHTSPMLSLDKCYDDQTLVTWVNKFEGDILAMPKMDGIAASLRYDDDGRLALAATRGDGLVGDDITANALTINDIPQRIDGAFGIEVRGEVYMRLSVFAAFADRFANPRNLAAGAIKQKDTSRCRDYRLSFAAYDLLGTEHSREDAKMTFLKQLGFAPVDHRMVSRDRLSEAFSAYSAERDALDYEIDGVVFRAAEVAEQRRLGETAHHPRYAIAYKFQGDSATTLLQDVEWSVARTGVITPVAILAPVNLSGAIISRASLHHAGFVDKLGLTRDATVVVTRRGGVIPKVEWVEKAGEQKISLPVKCPGCGSEAVPRGDFLVCSAPEQCRGALLGALAHYCSVVDIQGFGDKLLADAFDNGFLQSPVDFYRLNRTQLLELARIGAKTADNLLEQVQRHREIELSVFLRALGIEELGKHVAGILAERYATLDAIRAVSADALAAIHSIGEITATKVVAGLAQKAALIDELTAHVTVVSPTPVAVTDGPLKGKSVVFTGKLITGDRKQMQQAVRAAGGSTPSSVTNTLDYLVVGDGGAEQRKSSKLQKAEKLIAQGSALRIISEADFSQLLTEKASG